MTMTIEPSGEDLPDPAGGPVVPEPLRRFCWDIQSMVELADDPREILMIGRDLMGRLVAADDWMPEAFTGLGDGPFRQYQLYADQLVRFTVVASVLAPGARLPLCAEPAWELAGVLRGAITRQRFALPEGTPPVTRTDGRTLGAGAVDSFVPKGGDGLLVANASAEAPAILIQVHGAEIGGLARRAVAADGATSDFITAYANPPEMPAYDILSIQARIVD